MILTENTNTKRIIRKKFLNKSFVIRFRIITEIQNKVDDSLYSDRNERHDIYLFSKCSIRFEFASTGWSRFKRP